MESESEEEEMTEEKRQWKLIESKLKTVKDRLRTARLERKNIKHLIKKVCLLVSIIIFISKYSIEVQV